MTAAGEISEHESIYQGRKTVSSPCYCSSRLRSSLSPRITAPQISPSSRL